MKHFTPSKAEIKIDRLTICFNDPSIDNVKATCGLLLSDQYTKAIPGIQSTVSPLYEVSARILVPFLNIDDNTERHPVFFQAGPRRPGLSSYRLDLNPYKLPTGGVDDLRTLLESTIDATPQEFFHDGRVTRVDIAIDIPGHTVNDLILVTSRKQKHGVY